MIKTYEKYKSSRITWIGNIPIHWMLTKTKFCSSFRMGQTILKEELIEDGEYPVFSATEGDHYFGRTNNPSFILEVGDIVIPARGNSIGHIALVHEAAVSTQTTIANFINKKKINSHYLFYFYKGFRKTLFHYDNTAIPQVTVDQVKQNPVLLPPFEEQTKIVQYLDHQTNIIDQLIQKKEKLIELLKEKRQTVINEAVTKGLNPNAKMKDSGIEWLGEVPGHWSVSFLKRFCLKITDGAHFSPKTEFEGRNYISVKDVDEFGNIDLINCKKISQADFDDLVRNGCQPAKKDVLLTKDGTIGRAAVVKDENDFVALSSLGIITPDERKLDSDYLRFFLISGINVEQMFSLIAGAALTRLTIEKMKHLVITIPPINEQREIISRLEIKVVGFDNSIEKISIQIEKLKEYRQTIISEAVTGKIDLRQWQPKKQQVS